MKIKGKESKLVALGLIIVLTVSLTGCMPGANPHAASGSAGFLTGLWHGFICFFSLICSLFWDVSFYEVNNNGWWYNLGFLLGAGSILGGGGRASRRNRTY